jgi:hypothetical protein
MDLNDDQTKPMAGDLPGLPRRTEWQVLFFELFVAVSLSVAFFFLVRPCFETGDLINRYLFTCGSKSLYQMDQPIMGMHWNGRLGGLLLTGRLVDFSLNNEETAQQNLRQMGNAFAFYQTFWLLALFLAVIFALRDALLINLGIFAGLMYNFSPASGPYFFPWDMPAMFFFTIAILFFEWRKLWLMAVTICAGCFFKETVLVCALLVLFAGDWKWGKRVLVFLGILMVYVIGKRFLLDRLNLGIPVSSVGDTTSLSWIFSPTAIAGSIMGNLKVLFSPTLNNVIFANAGTLVAVLVLCWRRQFLPYMTVILAYIAGLVLVPLTPPGITEPRVFMQVLPLSFILLNEWRMLVSASKSTADSASVIASKWVTRPMVCLLGPMVIFLIVICGSVGARQYFVVSRNFNAYDAETKLARDYMNKKQLPDALEHEEKALRLRPNSITALNNVAWLRATASDASLRDGKEAVELAERACALTKNKESVPLTTLAAAYAEDGRFDDAIAVANQAIELAKEKGETNVVEMNKQLLQLYMGQKAYRQSDSAQTNH